MIVVFLAEAAAHDPVFRHFARQQNFHHVVELEAFFPQGFPELLGLDHIAGEAVQQPAVLALGLQGFQHHGNGDVVGHQVAAVNIGLGFFAQFRAAADMFAEDGAGFDVGKIVFLFDQIALGALAAAVGSENQDIHRCSP